MNIIKLKYLKRVYKIYEDNKEFGFTFKEKKKLQKSLSIFFVNFLWLHFKFLIV